MSFVSLYFIIFLAVLFLTYYLTPKRFRWIVLLIASLVFILLCSWKSIFFLLFATICIYFAAVGITKNKDAEKEYLANNTELTSEDKKSYKAKNKKKRKLYMVLGIVAVLLVLGVMKYLDFIIGNINGIISWFNPDRQLSLVHLFLPLGISFYTFQAIGYLADVYWGKYPAEKIFFKFLLFMSFLPKIIQGPIIRYNEIHDTLFEGHDFDYQNFTDGMKRILWGFFKKLVIANCLFVFTKHCFENYLSIHGFEAILTIIAYFIADYCDFSGYMDIACGMSLSMGIILPENFNHPYFAKGIDEYWRRWHITLGAWFKDYIFYPLSISKFSLNLGKKSKKIFGKFAIKIPAIFGLILVWFLTGLWHGASWNYIAWGLYFGLIIILSIIFEPLFNKFYEKTKINRNNVFLNILRHIRTLILLAFGKVLFETNSIPAAFGFFGRMFDFRIYYFDMTNIYTTVGYPSFYIALVLSIVVFVVDLVQELKPDTTMLQKFNKLPLAVQWILLLLLVAIVITCGYYGSGLPRFEFGYQVF